MAVAFGSAGTYLTYGSHTNSTLVAPASIADGDLLLAYLFVAADPASPAVTTPAGWSELTGSPTSVTQLGFNAKYHVYWKIAASEAGNYTFTHTTASSCGVIARYTGVDTSTPFSPTPTTNTGVNATATATGFTTTVASTFIIFTEHDWADETNDTFVPAGTTPTFTERVDTVLLYIADGTLASAGATGNKSHTNNNNVGNPWGAYLIGLNPAGAGGGSTTLNANPSSYTLTGSSAALAGKAVASGGSYALTGTATAFAYKQTVAAGAYTLTGTAAGLNVTGNLVFPAAAGAYTLSGSDAAFTIASASFTLFCGSGSYNLSGTDVSFPGYDPAPPVQPSTGGGYVGAWSGPKRRKRKRDEIEELIDAVIQAPPQIPPQTPQIPQPPPPALIDLMPKMQAVGLTPPQRKIVKRAIVTDDPDDDEEAIELLLNLLS